MGKIKDLFDITEDDFKKKDIPENNTNNMIKIPTKEKNDKIIKNEKEKEEIQEQPKKVKKYFKYRDGRVKYISLFSRKDSRNMKEIKEGVSDSLTISKNRPDKGIVLRNLSIVIIIASLIFMYFYYIRDSSGLTLDKPEGEVVLETPNDIPNQSGDNKNNKNEEINSLTSDEIIYSVKIRNGKELEKIEKYLNLKSNRVSTISDINKYKKEKEDLYLSLIASKNKLSDNEFSNVEDLIIKSIGMSAEFLDAFESNKGNSGLKEVIAKYTSN